MSAQTPDLETIQLASGSHADRSNGLCVMEVVAWLAGEPHSDSPGCVCPMIAQFVRTLNDSMNDEHRQMLKPYLKRLIGTRADLNTELRRMWIVADYSIRMFAPFGLRAAGLEDEARKLESLAPVDNEAAGRAAGWAAEAAGRAAEAAGWAAGWAAEAAGWKLALDCLDAMLAVGSEGSGGDGGTQIDAVVR